MDKVKAGHVCAARGCNSTSYSDCKTKLRFFRFPKDIVRARTWLIASGREDLLNSDCDKLNKSYRICSRHFETNMTASRYLMNNANPTIFSALEGYSSRTLHLPIECKLFSPLKINPIENIVVSENADIKQKLEEEEIHIKDEITNTEQETLINDENADYLKQYVQFLTENNYVDNENDPNSESDFPSLDFFMDELEKHNLNYRKEFVGQCLKALDIRFKDDHLVCHEVYLANVPVLPKHLKQINQQFYFKNNKTPTTTAATTQNSASQAAIEETITEIGIYYGSINVIPTFEDIFKRVQNLHKDITGEILKDWLNKLKVNFKTNGQENNSVNNETRRRLRRKNHKNKPTIPPTLDYFYINLKKFGINCSKSALKNWLDVLNVQYELSDFKKQAKNSFVHEELTSNTITSILNIEKHFYRSSNKKITQISSNRVKQILEAQKQNKMQCIKQNKKRQQENDNASNKIKRPRIETVDLTNIDNEKINNTEIVKKRPTFDYLYSKFRRAVCCKYLFKSWLDLLNINYSRGYNIAKCQKRKNLPSATVTKALIKIDRNYSQPIQSTSWLLLQLLEDLDEQFKRKRETPTLQFIDNHVQSLNHFNSNTWYSISKLQKWLNALNIKFLKDEQEEEIPNFFVYQKPLPTLDYFYEKIYEAEQKCCKSMLKEWLKLLTIKFESTCFLKTEDCQIGLSSPIIDTIVDAEGDFYEHQKISLISIRYLKIVENEFKNQNDVPTLNDYCDGIHRSNFFKTCADAYTKPQIQWLLNKLKFKIKIANNKEDKKIPNLDYFYEKLLSLNGDFCSKETLAYWLKLSNIQFEEHNIEIESFQKKPIPPEFINTLFKLSNFAKTYNLECIIKQLKMEFVSNPTPISLIDIHKRIETRNIKITIPNLRKWLDLIEFDYKERSSYCESIETIPNVTTNVQQASNVDTSIKDPEVEASIMDSKSEGGTQTPHFSLLNQPTKPDINASSAPDEVMKRLTDTEYTFFKSNTVPTLDDFQKNLEVMYGNKYAKDQTAMWLKNANIKFRGTCSCIMNKSNHN